MMQFTPLRTRHHLIEVKQYTSLPGGDTLMNTLLQDVSFDGVTDGWSSSQAALRTAATQPPARRRGLQTASRRRSTVGIGALVFHTPCTTSDGSLVRVGEWTACNAKDTSCAFSGGGFGNDSALQFSADNARPGDVELQFALPQHTTQIIGCDANGHAGRGMAGDRLINSRHSVASRALRCHCRAITFLRRPFGRHNYRRS